MAAIQAHPGEHRITDGVTGRGRGHRRQWAAAASSPGNDRVILIIASQNYGTALYGLCHLLAAISASGKYIHELLITEDTLSARFVAARFDEADLPDNIVLEEDCWSFMPSLAKHGSDLILRARQALYVY